MKKLLLVDDEERMLNLLALYLEPAGYTCDKVTRGSEAVGRIQTKTYDLVLLDIMMPEMDGWEVCRQIREVSQVPVIMLTARTEKPDVVKGLKIGADDYISKPFDEKELLARIAAVLRRSSQYLNETIEKNGLKWDPASFQVSYLDQSVSMTPKEFALLGLFLQHPNQVFSREQLLTSIWGYQVETEDRTIDSHIRNVRDKLRDAEFPIYDHLQTVWGVGYKWVW
ncbi:response regulator transcription factor [Heyndrickxia acidiproducens]|uniref:response regulator transcription factor n=1 Tax=Heyndrickxia acidiproducens TaxID=1121084 RepID=UPI00035CC1FE|nr:response regulator transcription factor [Heyndrickxia acidiproducens]